MKISRLMILVGLPLVLSACDDTTTARRALENMDFADIQVGGFAPFMCGKGDTFATKFTAKNAHGKTVTGAVCSSWLTKGATVRFD